MSPLWPWTSSSTSGSAVSRKKDDCELRVAGASPGKTREKAYLVGTAVEWTRARAAVDCRMTDPVSGVTTSEAGRPLHTLTLLGGLMSTSVSLMTSMYGSSSPSAFAADSAAGLMRRKAFVRRRSTSAAAAWIAPARAHLDGLIVAHGQTDGPLGR